eukprot:TRINITY_DN24371_c0_g1_i4.p1 TRINITY_DN24371_c0_g1~~TRINITY_DN24371_c0_g1_i4.p1  ORF type:complete len:138 (-),score=14.18 TRINITY_DN24371_c0_g1_i4:56-469(-)
MPLSTVLGTVNPVSVQKVGDGEYLYTFPRNFVGTIQLPALTAAATGASVTVLAGEWLVNDTAPSPPARCQVAAENAVANLGSCPAGKAITNVSFASFGTPAGNCADQHFTIDPKCHAPASLAHVKSVCLGKQPLSFI